MTHARLGALVGAAVIGVAVWWFVPRAAGAPVSFTVGAHDGTTIVPAGWTAIDQGRQIRLRRDTTDVVIQDLGPVGPDGVRREIEKVRDLWRSGQLDAARSRLQRVPAPGPYVAMPAQRAAIDATWSAAHNVAAGRVDGDVPGLLEQVLTQIAAEPHVSDYVDDGLRSLGHDQRRAVKMRSLLTVSGRPAVYVETWHGLSHADPRRFLFILNNGYLLAVYPYPVEDPAVVAAFEAVRDSLRFE